MSQENIEVLRAFFAAWNVGDMDALRELHDPDVIMRAPKGWPEPGPELGRNAVMRQFEQLRETWDTDQSRRCRLAQGAAVGESTQNQGRARSRQLEGGWPGWWRAGVLS